MRIAHRRTDSAAGEPGEGAADQRPAQSSAAADIGARRRREPTATSAPAVMAAPEAGFFADGRGAVSVGEEPKLRRGPAHAGADRGALAAILFVAQHAQLRPVARLKLAALGQPIVAAVVDDEHLVTVGELRRACRRGSSAR